MTKKSTVLSSLSSSAIIVIILTSRYCVGFSLNSNSRSRDVFDRKPVGIRSMKVSEKIIDSYDPSVTGGCVRNLKNHIRLLDLSLKKSSGTGMFEWMNTKNKLNSSIETAEELDQNTRFGVLSHGTQTDPIFNYGNRASLELFEETIENLCQTPSRYSTVPELMEDRSLLIEQIETKGYGYITDAVRISAKGNLFLIDEILVWTLYDDDTNQRIGLAAIYDREGVSAYRGEGDYQTQKS